MSDAFRIRATGDIFVDHDDPYSLLEAIAPVLQDSDLTIANLEGPCSDRGTPLPEKEYFDFGIGGSIRMPPAAVEAVKRAGVDVVSLANNHGMDYGTEALLQTVDLLKEHGVSFAGGGATEEEAREPAIVERDGVRIAFLSYTSVFTPVCFPARGDNPGLACIRVDTTYEAPMRIAMVAPGAWPRARTVVAEKDREAVLDEVRRAKERADIVVVGYHWGISGHGAGTAMGIPSTQTPTAVADYQEDMGRAIIDEGASFVIGHHPHRLQGFEAYNGGLIAYSLGNLAFSFTRPHFDLRTCVMEIELAKGHDQVMGCRLIPAVSNADTKRIEPVSGEAIEAFVPYLTELSVKYDTTFELAKDGQSIEIALAGR